jgi:hypothetical protein
LQPLPSFSSVASPTGFPGQQQSSQQSQQQQHQMQPQQQHPPHLQRTGTGLENLNVNVDFDSLLGSLNGGGNAEDFDIFGNMAAAQHDAGAIFVPVDNGAGASDFGQQTTSPNGGLQQWVSSSSSSSFFSRS